MSTLVLEYWTDDEDFCIYASAGDFEKELKLEGRAEKIVKDFDTLYEILEEKHEDKEATVQKLVRALSDALLVPFFAQIEACDLVRVVISEELIRCAFDLLWFDGTYLFLRRKVCYQMVEGEGEDAPHIPLESALLIADLTADPEEACKQVAKLIPQAQYAKVEDASLRMIKDAADQVDALIISAHGNLDEDNEGEIEINEEELDSDIIGKLEAWIVYFDSCQQGANLEFVQAFQEDSDVQFYLAPVISNDAGDSSTHTLIWFFTDVRAHGDPITALFETRKRLFEFYTVKKKLALVESLNKAFPFRLYEFVEEEE